MTHNRLLHAFAAIVMAVLFIPASASAGGWAVTSIDEIPAVTAGSPAKVGLTILQHGSTPVDVEDVAIVLIGADGVRHLFPAHQDGRVGHYVAEVTVPDAGTYRWTVQQGWFGDYDLGSLNVVSSTTSPSGFGTSWWRYGLTAASALCGLIVIADVVASRRRRSAVTA